MNAFVKRTIRRVWRFTEGVGYAVLHPSVRRSFPRFVNDVGSKYFLPLNEPTPDDVATCRAIIREYRIQCQDAQDRASQYGAESERNSALWHGIIDDTKRIVRQFLRAGEAHGLSYLMANFFRTIGAKGLSETPNYNRGIRVLDHLEIITYTLKRYQRLQRRQRASQVSLDHLLESNDIGRPVCVQINGHRVHSDNLIKLEYMHFIAAHAELPTEQRLLVVDLGPGYGGMLKTCLQQYGNACAVALDLPDTLVYASYYLARNFPDKRVCWYSDWRSLNDPRRAFQEYDICLLPWWCIAELPDDLVDVFINCASLSEMRRDVALGYLRHIARAVRPTRYFFSCNRWIDDVNTFGETEYGQAALLEAAGMTSAFEQIAFDSDLHRRNGAMKGVLLRKQPAGAGQG